MGVTFSKLRAEAKLRNHEKLCKTIWDETVEGTGRFADQLKELHASLESFDFLPLEKRCFYRKKAGDMMVKTRCMKIVCEQLGTMVPQYDANKNPLVSLGRLFTSNRKTQARNNKKKQAPSKSCLDLGLESVALITEPDCSKKACSELLKYKAFLDALEKRLEKMNDDDSNLKDAVVYRKGLTIFHNIAAYLAESRDGYTSSSSNKTDGWGLQIKRVFGQRVRSDNKEVKLMAITALACLNEVLIGKDQIQFLCLNLSMTLAQDYHRILGCTYTAMARGVRHLLTVGTYETPKELGGEKISAKWSLQKCGILSLLMAGVTSEIKQESMACLESLWVLSRSHGDMKVESTMAGDRKFMEMLVKLNETSPETDVQDLTSVILLSLLKNHDVNLEKKPAQITYGKRQVKTTDSQNSQERHVMLSYQWERKKTVLKINEYLQSKGVTTWFDDDKMCDYTNITDAMATAVENCAVFLMCVTKKYRESENCKKEADYASACRKKIIPLQLEKDYKPDGWLGIIRGNIQETDELTFFDEEPEEKMLDKLQKRIREVWTKPTDASTSTSGSGEGSDPNNPNGSPGHHNKPAHQDARGIIWVTPFCRYHSEVQPSDGKDTSRNGQSKDAQVSVMQKENQLSKRKLLSGYEEDCLEVLADLRTKASGFFYQRIWQDLQLKTLADVRRVEKELDQWQKRKAENKGQDGDKRT